MSRNNMELIDLGDGTTRLTFWDSLHGDDLIFDLRADGSTWLQTGFDKDDKETFTQVDLVAELRRLAKELAARE